MPAPTFTTPPTAPTRASPSTFVSRANAFLAWLVAWVAELTAAVTWFGEQVTAVEAAQTAAETAQTNAETAETNAETAETAAEAARDLAQGYAASALGAPGTSATSATGRSLTMGSKDFVLDQNGKLFTIGQTVVVTRTSDTTKRMTGPITAVANLAAGPSPTITVDVQLLSSTGGPYTDWTIALAGALPALASQAEAEAGVVTDKWMSPERVAQAIDVQVSGMSAPHVIATSTISTFTGTVGAFRTFPLDTLDRNDGSHATLPGSNRLSLAAGVWHIKARACLRLPTGVSYGHAQPRIYNVTDAVEIGPRGVDVLYGTGDYNGGIPEAEVVVTLAATKSLEFQAYINNNTSGAFALSAISSGSGTQIYVQWVCTKAS